MKTVTKLSRLERILQDYQTSTEVARAAGLSQSRIRQLIIEGALPAVKVGNIWLVHVDDATSVRRKYSKAS